MILENYKHKTEKVLNENAEETQVDTTQHDACPARQTSWKNATSKHTKTLR